MGRGKVHTLHRCSMKHYAHLVHHWVAVIGVMYMDGRHLEHTRM